LNNGCNNPLKYRDPTGHVKETPEQEAMEEGAVGGVMAEKPEAEKHTTICKNIPSIDLTQSLARSLRIVFATFAEDVSADVQGGALLFCLVD
jgi:hypothetical protein